MKFTCKVITRSSKNEMVGAENLSRLDLGMKEKEEDLPEIKIYTRAVPVDGKANKEVIKIISEELGVPKSRVHILKGETSNKKIIEIDD